MKKLYTCLIGLILTGILLSPMPVGAQNDEVPISWNTTIVGNKYRVRQGWTNYKDGEEWRKIDLSLLRSDDGLSNDAGNYESFFPAFADGVFNFKAKDNYDPILKRAITDAPLSFDRVFTTAAHVGATMDGADIFYKDAFPTLGASLRIRISEEGVQYLVEWETAPDCKEPIVIPFEMSFDKDISLSKTSTESIVQSTANRAVSIGVTKSVDSELESVDFSLNAQRVGRNIISSKVITCDQFLDKKYPLVIDDVVTFNPSATALDGYVYVGGGSWASVHDSTAGTPTIDLSNTDSNIKALSQKESGGYYISRSFVLFDTSSLPTGLTITAAEIGLYNNSAGMLDSDNDGLDYVAIVGPSTPASDTTLVASDFDQTGSTEMSDTHIDVTTLNTDGFRIWDLNAAGIAEIDDAGISRYAVREGHDLTNTAIDGSDGLVQAVFHASEGTNDPYLEVTYTPASSASSAASSASSSAPPPTFTGSLLISHSYCNEYILNGSGDAVGCNQWDTTLETEFVAAMRVEAGAIAYSTVILMLRWFVILYMSLRVAIGLFRIITHYKPIHSLLASFRRRR